MANHLSAIKRIRQSQTKKLRNKYFFKTARNLVKNFQKIIDRDQAIDSYKKLSSILDKLAKRSIIHKNKASNLKSKLALYIQKLH